MRSHTRGADIDRLADEQPTAVNGVPARRGVQVHVVRVGGTALSDEGVTVEEKLPLKLTLEVSQGTLDFGVDHLSHRERVRGGAVDGITLNGDLLVVVGVVVLGLRDALVAGRVEVSAPSGERGVTTVTADVQGNPCDLADLVTGQLLDPAQEGSVLIDLLLKLLLSPDALEGVVVGSECGCQVGSFWELVAIGLDHLGQSLDSLLVVREVR